MKVKFITLGCKTNFYESQAMSELFREAGYTVIDRGKADIYIINTCTVTGTGAQKSRQHIRKAKKENPGAIVAVTGCFSQTEPEEAAKIEGVDVVLGNGGKGRIVSLVEKAMKGEKVLACTDIMKERTFEEIGLTPSQSRIRANVKIEDGCNNYCAYCIIPYARGPVRSRSIDKIVEEVNLLSQNGFLEIVLTGIHIGSYGKDLEENISLIDVIEAVSAVSGIKRVRLGSVEPVVITEDFVVRAARLENLCPQFHLSLQSGCTETLSRMRRRYIAEEYFDAVQLIRKHMPDASITTDLMVGFPGETDEEFNASYEFCKKIGFMQMHVFKYSIRKGTLAEKMENQVPERVKDERSEKMIALSEEMKKDFYSKFKGRKMEVLIESRLKDGKYHGTTANYMEVFLDVEECGDFCGKIIEVMI